MSVGDLRIGRVAVRPVWRPSSPWPSMQVTRAGPAGSAGCCARDQAVVSGVRTNVQSLVTGNVARCERAAQSLPTERCPLSQPALHAVNCSAASRA